MLGAKIDDIGSKSMLDAIGRNADDVAAAIDELKSLAGLDEEPDRLLEVDFGRMVREAINDAMWFADMHQVELRSDIPDVALPVLAPAGRSRETLDLLLDVGVLSAAPGSRVGVTLEEGTLSTAFVLGWAGAGFDPAVLAVCHGPWHEDVGALPRELRPYARARAVFPDLAIRSAVGQGTEVRFTLPRAGRT
jgi:signal transduction histidine kinase